MKQFALLLPISLWIHCFQAGYCQVPMNLDSLLLQKMKATGIVGMGASMIVHQQLVWSNGYGFSNQEQGTPFTTETIMNIGSIAKIFTGVCLMKAVEQGLLNLDEDINAYLPFKIRNPYFPEGIITLRQLATHTSTLADRYPFYSDSMYYTYPRPPEPLGEFLKYYFTEGGKHYSTENFVNAAPGTHRSYSNIGAGLVGYIIELKTGLSLEAFARKIIFQPLGMKKTHWSLNNKILRRHAQLYQKKNDRIAKVPHYVGTTYPDGGVRTSVHDLSRLFIALLNEGGFQKAQILEKATVEEMLRFQFPTTLNPSNVNPDKLNSGIFWATKMGATRIGHNGSDPGVRTFMLSDLKKEIGIVLFFNTELPDEEEVQYFEIYDLLYQYARQYLLSK